MIQSKGTCAALAGTITVLCAASASADLLYDSGDMGDDSGHIFNYDHVDTSYSRVYASFTVPVATTWSIHSIFGHVILPHYFDFTEVEEARYDIRTGMGPGSVGSSEASGVIEASFADAGYNAILESQDVGILDVTLGAPLLLGEGTYWVSLTPIVDDDVEFDAWYAVRSGNPGTGYLWVDTDVSGSIQPVIGIRGSSTLVPEPASLALLALGGFAWMGRRRPTA